MTKLKNSKLDETQKIKLRQNSKTQIVTRNTKAYNINNSNIEIYKDSAVPFMQRLFNEYEKNNILRNMFEDTIFSILYCAS